MADYYKFYGIRPIDNSLNYFEFNNPLPGHKNVLMWNTLLECYMYSEDAGLTWKKVWGTNFFELDHFICIKVDVTIIPFSELKEKVERITNGKYSKKERNKIPEYQLWSMICNAPR